MKSLAIIFGVLCLGVFTMLMEKNKKKGKETFFDESNEVDIEFTGPHGEKY